MSKVLSFRRSKGNVIVVDELEMWRKYLAAALNDFTLSFFDNIPDCLQYIVSNTVSTDCVIIGMGIEIYPGLAFTVSDEFPDIKVIFLPDRDYEILNNYDFLPQKYEPLTPSMFQTELIELISQ